MREESFFRQIHEDHRQGSVVLGSSLFYVYNVHIPVTKTVRPGENIKYTHVRIV